MSEDSTATTQAFPPGGAGAGFLGAGTAGSGMASSGTGSSTAATSPHEVARLLKRPKVREASTQVVRMSQMELPAALSRQGAAVNAHVHCCMSLAGRLLYFQVAEGRRGG